jgi:hypothetical protein
MGQAGIAQAAAGIGLAPPFTAPIEAIQYDALKNLPPRPPSFVKPNDPDPIGTMIESVDIEALAKAALEDDSLTGSIPKPEGAQ